MWECAGLESIWREFIRGDIIMLLESDQKCKKEKKCTKCHV